MAKWLDVYRFEDAICWEYKWVGEFGKKGEKRAPHKKPSPEQMKYQNQWNREKRIRYLIYDNFKLDDLWTTLKYKEGTRPSPERVKKNMRKFLAEMRKMYKERGEPFKFIYRMEIGKGGGAHIHILINKIVGETDSTMMIRRAWKKVTATGSVNFRPLDEEGPEKLAYYITKPLEEEIEGQLNLFGEQEHKQFMKYSTSRNLKRSEPEVKGKYYSRRTMEKLLTEGIAPTPGFYVVKDSIRQGTNPMTGLSYLYYSERRVVGRASPPGGDDES